MSEEKRPEEGGFYGEREREKNRGRRLEGGRVMVLADSSVERRAEEKQLSATQLKKQIVCFVCLPVW